MMKKFFLYGAAIVAVLSSGFTSHAAEVRVMTFNLWQGGEAGGQPLQRSIEAIRLANADIVGLQETFGRDVAGKQTDNGKEIAKAMGSRRLAGSSRLAWSMLGGSSTPMKSSTLG